MLGRRFLLLVAVLMGLTALAASLAPREPLLRDRRTASPTPTPTATPPTGPKATHEVRRELAIGADPVRVLVREGDLVRLTVTGTELDSVSLLDEIEPIEPDSPAVFELLADEPGRYPIQLVEDGRRVGTLVVRPQT